MRRFFLFLLFAALAVTASGQAPGFDLSNYGVRIEPDRRVMVVLATLEMARTEGGEKLINTPLSDKGLRFREQLLTDTAGLNEDLRRRITLFITQYKKRHTAKTDADFVAPFISMAYTLS